jgi:hypothetical protein
MSTEETAAWIEETRQRLDSIMNTFTVETFRRLHGKFVGCVIAIEVGFKRRFPDEWDAYEKEFYGDDRINPHGT